MPRIAREGRAQRDHRPHRSGHWLAQSRAQRPRRGSSRRSATGRRHGSARAAASSAVKRVGHARLCSARGSTDGPETRLGERIGEARCSRLVRGDEARDDQAGGPSSGPRASMSPNPPPAAAASEPRPLSSQVAVASPAAARRPRLRRSGTLRGIRSPSAPAAPSGASRGRPRSDGSRAAARGCAGSRAPYC